MFHGLQALVVDVAPTAYPWWLGLASADGDRHQRLVDASLEARDAAQTGAESACRSLRAAGLTTQSCHRIGDPADELLRAAAELDVDTIVIGSRGQTGVARFVAGSVARHVIRHANASVVIVHPPRATAPATRGSPPAATLVSNH
jgi:nucleotide-binding universal stress UspA family protein